METTIKHAQDTIICQLSPYTRKWKRQRCTRSFFIQLSHLVEEILQAFLTLLEKLSEILK